MHVRFNFQEMEVYKYISLLKSKNEFVNNKDVALACLTGYVDQTFLMGSLFMFGLKNEDPGVGCHKLGSINHQWRPWIGLVR
jgi:hypothetical protein